MAAKPGIFNRQMAQLASECDSVFVNVQGVRGPRSLDLIRGVLEATRGCPTLLVANSPSEIFDMSGEAWPAFARVELAGPVASAFETEIRIVGRDRQQLEQTFKVTMEGLDTYSTTSAWLSDLATTAWWAAVRSVGTDESKERAVRNYLRAIEATAGTYPLESSRFSSFTNAVLSVIRDQDRAVERRAAILCAVADGCRTVLVASAETRHNLLELEPTLDTPEIQLVTPYEAWRIERPEPVVMLGLSGAASIDALLALRPVRAIAVVDPIEARVAAALLRRWNTWLHDSAVAQPAADALAAAFQERAGPGESAEFVDIGLDKAVIRSQANPLQMVWRADGEPSVRIRFVNGDELVCGRSKRFDVVADGSHQLRSKTAGDLEGGDEVIVVAADDAGVFSDRLIEALDAGRLKESAQKRQTLLRVISMAAKAHSMGPTRIVKALKAQKITITPAAVAGWLRGSHDDATVANSRAGLAALLSVLQTEMDAATVDEFWQAVRVVRTGHRLAGRQVVRAIRAAAAGRLHARTMAAIERDYGMNARQLVLAAQALVVDDVEELP